MINKHIPSPSERSNKRHASSASHPQLSPITKGLVGIRIKDDYLSPYVRQLVEQAIVENSDDLNPGFEGGSLLALYSGSGRQPDQARALHAANGLLAEEWDLNFEVVGRRSQYNWVSPEGHYTLGTILDRSDEEWFSMGFEFIEPINPVIAQNLAHIREAVKQANAGAVMFMTGKKDFDATELPQFFDEYIEAESCEPDPGDFIAFSINVFGVSYLNALGIGKQMCSIGVSAGRFRRRYAQYIAPDLQTRAMWALRAQGKKLAEIGSLLGVNKSTVMRRLEGLPDPRPGDPSGEDWLNRYLELLPNASTEALDDYTDSVTDAYADADADADENDDFEDFGESNFEN